MPNSNFEKQFPKPIEDADPYNYTEEQVIEDEICHRESNKTGWVAALKWALSLPEKGGRLDYEEMIGDIEQEINDVRI